MTEISREGALPSEEPGRITQLLARWRQGDEVAEGQLAQAVYEELHRLAGGYLRGERSDHTLQATALVHEAFLRLIDQRQIDWKSRGHFFGIAARMMRRILVDHARSHGAAKRGRDWLQVPVENLEVFSPRRPPDLVALDEALEELAELDPFKARVVELRFFAGFTLQEIAQLEGVALITVRRHWRLARIVLYRSLRGESDLGTPPGAAGG